ncbi:hypothetical protein E2C01_042041 [Portunus trituberculatus]|uniref:Uncharacterized protein n=1 Tax=Portunus trituberculatus TaxID=210409 RepID=A0A5B7FTI8_PORTR|nr:hypothetical protein [Portunus trituberculatus]
MNTPGGGGPKARRSSRKEKGILGHPGLRGMGGGTQGAPERSLESASLPPRVHSKKAFSESWISVKSGRDTFATAGLITPGISPPENIVISPLRAPKLNAKTRALYRS